MKTLTASVFVLVLAGMVNTGSLCRGQAARLPQKIVGPVDQAISIRQETQKKEEKWRLEKERLAARYSILEKRLARLESRRDELRSKVSAARRRISAKQKQLNDIRQISDQIIPCLKELHRQLKQMVADDLPFLPAERQRRLEGLDRLLEDPDAAAGEKFRKLMEALLVEAEYGTTIEVYQQSIPIDGQQRLVNIFRLGRIALFFQSLDGQTCGFFNVAANNWQLLPAKYNRSLAAAIDMGAKRRPVDMVTLPLGRLVVP